MIIVYTVIRSIYVEKLWEKEGKSETTVNLMENACTVVLEDVQKQYWETYFTSHNWTRQANTKHCRYTQSLRS